MKKAVMACVFTCLIPSAPAFGFESDVHFGLTQWLAVRAGYTKDQAKSIATGDQRVDSGDMQFMDFLSEYACGSRDLAEAEEVRTHHFASAKGLPNSPRDRVVVAGSDASRKALEAVIEAAPGRESFLLFKFGEGLHVLQDSWSNQGIPSVPSLSNGIGCDPAVAWAPPAARGGWASHRADITAAWPADTIAMAAATYEVLAEYPPIQGHRRTARTWSEIAPSLKGFVDGKTKQAKADWFVSQGMPDVSFLEGISLPDGRKPFLLTWNGRKLPALQSISTRQHDVPKDLLLFFNGFFQRWLTGDDFQAIAAEFGLASAPLDGTRPKRQRRLVDAATAELAARLRLWRFRDHGSVDDLAHASSPLTRQQVAKSAKLARKPGALATYATLAEAVIPFLPDTASASPLLPFLITFPPVAAGTDQIAMATVRLRTAPYDAVEVVAERRAAHWRIVSLTATVEH